MWGLPVARALAESPIVAAIEELDLNFNVIGDKGLKSLAQSPHLRPKRLLLRNNQITDEGVWALARGRLPEWLEHLNLKENSITRDSVIEVEKAGREHDYQKKIDVAYDAGLHLRQHGRLGLRS